MPRLPITSAQGQGPYLFLVNSLASVQSAPPIEKCSAKPTAFGVATNPSCIHSGGSLVRWIDPTHLHSRYEDANVGFRFTNRTSTVEPSGPELKAFEHTFVAGATSVIPRVPPTIEEKYPHGGQLVQALRRFFLTPSAVFSGEQTERERLFHQNMTGRSRHRIVDSSNLGFPRRNVKCAYFERADSVFSRCTETS